MGNVITQLLSVKSFKSIKRNIKVGLATKKTKKQHRKENINLALENHSDEASSINSKNNHIEEVFKNDASNEVSTEV